MRIETFKRRLLGVWLTLLSLAGGASATDWKHMEEHGGVAYFFISQPAQVARYDKAARTWLAPLILPPARGALTTGTIDADGLYIAYDSAVYRYPHNLSGELHLINATGAVQNIFTDGELLIVNFSNNDYLKLISINKTTNTFIRQHEVTYSPLLGATIARGMKRLFGYSSYSKKVNYIDYRLDGSFSGGAFTQFYNNTGRAWVLPGEGRVLDGGGALSSSSSLESLLQMDTPITDVRFYGDTVPVVLNANQIRVYNNAFQLHRTATLAANGKAIALDGTDILVFRPNGTDPIAVEVVPLSTLNPPAPSAVVNPAGLAYKQDAVFVKNDGVVHLYSKAHQSIFRWSPDSQSYLESIPLSGVPSYVAYSPENELLYTSYKSKEIKKLDFNALTAGEVPFVTLPYPPTGLSTAGVYVLSVDNSGSWNTHYTYSPAGVLISSKTWNYASKEFVWSPANQKMYFMRDGMSPNDLLWEEINAAGAYPALAAGAIGNIMDSPLHDSTGFIYPIRVKDDGSLVALGSGFMHAGQTLARHAYALSNSFTDGAWVGDHFYSARNAVGMTQFQQWLAPTFGQAAILQVPNSPNFVRKLPSGLLVAAAAAADHRLSFYVLDTSFNLVAPPVIAAPAALTGTVESTTAIRLNWQDVTGETSYLIERRSGQGGWQTLGTTTVSLTTFLDTTPVVGSTYEYRVTARNAGKQSAPSLPVNLRFDVPPRPGAPIATVLTASSIRVDWDEVALASSYRVFYRAAGAAVWTTSSVLPVPTQTLTVSGLTAGTNYEFKLTASNVVGSSADSELTQAATLLTVPPAPSLTVAPLSSHSVRASWATHYLAQHYRLERRLGAAGSWELLAEIDAPTATFLDQTVTFNTSYSYRLFASNPVGQSGSSVIRTVTTPNISPPPAPFSLRAGVANLQAVSLSWNIGASAGHSPALGVEVRRWTQEDGWGTLATLAPDATQYIDTTVALGETYRYQVAAHNEGGSASSEQVEAEITLDYHIHALAQRGLNAPGAADIVFGNPKFAAVSSEGKALYQSTLSGPGSAGGGRQALFTCSSGTPSELVLQTGPLTINPNFGLPFNTRATQLHHPLFHQPGRALFQAVVTGTGVHSGNNRLLLRQDGTQSRILLRTGIPIGAGDLASASMASLNEVLQGQQEDVITVHYRLQLSRGAKVTKSSDTGMLLLRHSGVVISNFAAREGLPDFGGSGVFGQFTGISTAGLGGRLHFTAWHKPASGKAVPAVFSMTPSGSETGMAAYAGKPAPEAAGAVFSAFPALSQSGPSALVRATLKGGSKAANEGLWNLHTSQLLVAKGGLLDAVQWPDVKIKRILRFWPAGAGVMVQVQLAGKGVSAANNQALLLRQTDGVVFLLLRTGVPAPGVVPARLRAISAVEVNPVTGMYAVLGTLAGAAANANQALWMGNATYGDNSDFQHLRLPQLVLRKGEFYSSGVTPLSGIRSLAMWPAQDRTGAGGRGLAQILGGNDGLAVFITSNRNLVELVLLNR